MIRFERLGKIEYHNTALYFEFKGLKGAVDKLNLRISVIVNTYNTPRALALVLAALRRQTCRDFELVIADDGSGDETREVIDGFSKGNVFQIKHVWHEDKGFRLCTILNKAILAASGDYIVFLGGDCIPTRTCIETHRRAARPGHYVVGGKVNLDQMTSDRVMEHDIEQGFADKFGWFWLYAGKRRRLFVSKTPLLRDLLNRTGKDLTWFGENASTFKAHILWINGLDERFIYGHEDIDFGSRLNRAGFKARSIRYTTPVLHLEHPRPYGDQEKRKQNEGIYEENNEAHIIYTPYGIVK